MSDDSMAGDSARPDPPTRRQLNGNGSANGHGSGAGGDANGAVGPGVGPAGPEAERRLIRAHGRSIEAMRSQMMCVILCVLAALIALVGASSSSSPNYSGRLSAALLEAIVFLVAGVTLQVSWGRYVQGRRSLDADQAAAKGKARTETRHGAEQKPHRKWLRIVGWCLTLVPVVISRLVFSAVGLRLSSHSVGARLVALNNDDPMTAIWVHVGLVVACAALTTFFCVQTRRMDHPSTAGLRDKDAQSETSPARGVIREHRVSAASTVAAPGTGNGAAATMPVPPVPPVPSATQPVQETPPAQRGPLVLAFSGGGIRSASYCLGGFNALQATPALHQVDAIVSVSGGSYAAAAINLTRSFAPDGSPRETEVALESVYSLDSPELAYLRRNSRYIYQPVWRTISGLWQLLSGAVFNLFLAVAALRFIAWVLGWYAPAVGLVTGLRTSSPNVNLWPDTWAHRLLAAGPWVIPLGLIAVLLVVQGVRRGVRGGLIGRPSESWWARAVARLSRVVVLAGLALVLVPTVIVGVSRLGYTNQPTAVVAKAIANLGFTRPGACASALATSANSAHDQAVREARLEAKRATASYGACGASGTVAIGGPPAYTDGYQADQAIAAAGGVPAKSGISGQLMSVILILGAAIASLRRSFTAVGKALGGRGAALRRFLLLRLPLTALGVLALWLVAQWSYQYSISAETLTQLWGPALVALAVILQLVNPNLTSLHEFYRERLSSAFAVARDQPDVAGAGVARNLKYRKPYNLSALRRSPEAVLCTTANVNDQRVVPTRRFGVPMTLSPVDVRLEAGGLDPAIGYQDTAAVEDDPRGPAMTVMGGVAMSGAAVSPLMGRMGGKVAPFRLLLTLFNIRLGVWVMNPRWPLGEADAPSLAPMSTNPRFHQLFSEAFGSTMVNDRWLYLTDGGHLDNLGLVEAVRRLPQRVMALSASNDPAGSWQDVGAAVSVIRADLGIDLQVKEIDEDGTWMRLAATGPVSMQVLVVKAGLTPPEPARDKAPKTAKGQVAPPAAPATPLAAPTRMPIDVRSFATRDASFPRTSTGRQDFGDLEFESYRRLGQYLVERALAANPSFLGPVNLDLRAEAAAEAKATV